MSTLPDENDVRLILADDFRQEQGAKLTILGFYGSNEVNIHSSAGSVVVLPSLAFLWWITGAAEGPYAGRFTMQSPSGAVVIDGDNRTIVKNKDASAVFLTKISPFEVKERGPYKVAMILDGRAYERSVTIRLS